MKNLQSSILQKRKETYLKLQNRFLKSLSKGEFENKNGRSKHHWIEKLKKLERQIGLVSNLKLKHWALAFTLGFVTIAGNTQAQQKQEKNFAPFKHYSELKDKRTTKNRTNGTERTSAVSIFSEQPVFGDGLLSENQAIGDFDSDGDDDLIMFSYYGPTKIFVNDGTGNISNKIEIFSSSYGLEEFAIGDIDGDADLDIVLIEESTGSQSRFTYLVNDGAANFTASSSAFGARKNRLKLSDIDNDSDLDILAQTDVGGYVYELKIFDNNGTGNFTESASLNFLPQSDLFNVSTFTSDAFPDIAVTNNSDTLKVFVNDGAGGFTVGAVVNTVLSDTNNRLGPSGDIDGDGDIDMLLYDNRLSMLENDGTGLFTENLIKDDTVDTYLVWFDPIIADFNGDTNLDILTWETSQNNIAGSGAKIFTGDGANNFTELAQTVKMNSGNSYSAGQQIMDFDGDGNSDIVLSSYTDMELFRNDGTANFTTFNDQIVNVFYGTDSDLIDLDGDGDLDAILSFTDKVLINDGQGNFVEGQEIASTASYYYLATGDFDNDSDIDVVYQNDDVGNEFVVWLNSGAATFTVGSSFATSDSNDQIRDITSGDMNGDSIFDVVTMIKNDTSGVSSIDVWTNNGSGSFVQNRTTSANKLEVVKLADIDGDSDLDLITKAQDISYQSLGLAIYTNNAGTLTQNTFLTPADTLFRFSEGFTAGDIDGDGDVDIVAINDYGSAPYKVNLFTNDGAGAFTSSIIANTSGAYGSIVLEDFDLDGDIDLFVAGNEYQDELWVNDGAGNFSLSGMLDSKSYTAQAGDIDGDGDKDLFTLEIYQGNRFIVNNTNQASQLGLDSAQLVVLYDETGGDSWTDKTNWKTGDVSTWFGVTVVADRVTAIDLNTNNLTGAFTVNSGLDSLTTLNLSGNLLTGIPDLSGTSITTIDVSGNQLEFGSLEVNAAISGINYANQATIGTAKVDAALAGSDYVLSITTSGTANLYQWYKDAVAIPGSTSSIDTLSVIDITDEGDYYCEVTNSLVSGLTLTTELTSLSIESVLGLDSAQLVLLYDETGGDTWTDNTNWKTGDVSTWFGITVTNDRVSTINLPSNNLTGAITINTDLDSLTAVDVSGNLLTAIPDFSATNITTLNVSQNQLEFGSLEANAGIAGINYANQDSIGVTSTQNVPARSDYPVVITTSGTVNQYQWFKDGTSIAGAIDSTYTITSVRSSNVGDYFCEVTNTTVTGLTLFTRITTVNALASISGTVLLDATTPLTSGEILLLGITNTNGYDTTSLITVGADGSYIHTDAPIGDYVTLAKPDTMSFSSYLPTYWGEISTSFLWEEADTIRLDSTIVNLDILLQGVPADKPAGEGIISGILDEDVPDGGKIEAKKRVAGAGVSVRRVRKQGKSEEDELELVAYIYTNADGEFVFENLEEDNYKLNIQYPGYPMDPNSFIDIPIGTGSNSEVTIEAFAADGKIVVTDVTVTSIFENSNFPGLIVYPNPSSQRLFLKGELHNETELMVVLHSVDGKKINFVNKKVIALNTEGIDISMLEKGVYILEVFTLDNQLIKTTRIVVAEK